MISKKIHSKLLLQCGLAAFFAACALPTVILAAQDSATADGSALHSATLGEMFTFFFLMLGPIKILGPFVQMTRGGDAAFARKLAIRGFLFSCAALAVAALIGENSIRKYHIHIAVLAIAAGVILFLVALQTVLHQFDHTQVAHVEYQPNLRLAVSPLAFPTIVTPYGVAAVIIFMSLTPDIGTRGEIFAALLGLMVLNLIAMLFAKPILKYAGMPLQLLGTVLGIIQVALGLQIIIAGMRALGLGFSR